MKNTQELIEALEIAIGCSDCGHSIEIGKEALISHRNNPKILLEILEDVHGSMDCELSAVKYVQDIIVKHKGSI